MCSKTQWAGFSPVITRLQLEAACGQRDELPRLDLADHLRADDVEGAALGRDHEALREAVLRLHLSQRQRAHPMRVAEGDNGMLVMTTVE